MKSFLDFICSYKRSPLKLAGHAWLLFLLSLVAMFLLLPTAHALYHGDSPLAGYLLHRSFIALFLFVIASGFTALILELFRQRGLNIPIAKKLGGFAKAVVITIPLVLLGSACVFLMFFGSYIGLALT